MSEQSINLSAIPEALRDELRGQPGVVDDQPANLSSRLAEAEAVIDHYADTRRWMPALYHSGGETNGNVRYYGMDNGYDKARDYRAKYRAQAKEDK